MQIHVSSPQDAANLHNLNTWLDRPLVHSVEIAVANISTEERERLQRKIRALFNDCGCIWATPAFISTLGFSWMNSDGAVWQSPSGIVLAIMTAIFAAICAKLIALKESQIRLRRYLNHLNS